MKETFEIGRVMMHCGAASLVMKVIQYLWTYHHHRAFTVSRIVHVLDTSFWTFRSNNCFHNRWNRIFDSETIVSILVKCIILVWNT